MRRFSLQLTDYGFKMLHHLAAGFQIMDTAGNDGQRLQQRGIRQGKMHVIVFRRPSPVVIVALPVAFAVTVMVVPETLTVAMFVLPEDAVTVPLPGRVTVMVPEVFG